MATKPRIIAPQVYYHVTSKGFNGETIFRSPEMKAFFKQELQKSLKKFKFFCLAWSLMNDHFHLVVKSSNDSISLFMQRFNGVLARKYNGMENRKGTVFYRRFASVVVQHGAALREVIRYVHLNPVRCNLCTLDELSKYEWSGHKALSGSEEDQIVCKSEVFENFKGENSLREYSHYMESQPTLHGLEVLENVRAANLSCQNSSKPENWIIGESDFVRKILSFDLQKIPIARHRKLQLDPILLHQNVCATMGIDTEMLFRQARKNVRAYARQLFAYIGVTEYNFPSAFLARYLRVTGSAVSKMISRCDDVDVSLVEEICKRISLDCRFASQAI